MKQWAFTRPALTEQLPLAFGWTILINGLIWRPSLCSICEMPHARREGGALSRREGSWGATV